MLLTSCCDTAFTMLSDCSDFQSRSFAIIKLFLYLLYSAVYNVHVFAQISEGKTRMCIIHGCKDDVPWAEESRVQCAQKRGCSLYTVKYGCAALGPSRRRHVSVLLAVLGSPVVVFPHRAPAPWGSVPGAGLTAPADVTVCSVRGHFLFPFLCFLPQEVHPWLVALVTIK